MFDEDSAHKSPTRRDYMKYGGAVVSGGLLTGCAGQSDSKSTPTETEESGYSVTMAPVEEVQFDQPPERVTHYLFDRGRVADIINGDS